MQRPLPDDVARTARAYLAQLLPAGEVSDAWHELVADVAYWGDRDLVPVVRLAHQVVLQHQRLTPEVAVLALAEVGLDDPGTMAVVLDADPDQVARWADQASTEAAATTATVTITEPGLEDPAPRPDRVAAVRGPSDRDESVPDDDAPPSWDRVETAPTAAGDGPVDAPGSDVDAAPATGPDGGQPVRIGFDDDPLPDLESGSGRGVGRRDLLLAAAALAVVLLVLWLLLGR